MNYSYPYKVGNNTSRTVKIEYKASGPDYNSFYYFIMPDVAYANNVYCSIKRYTGFDSGYAINSKEKNPNITFVDYYGKGSRVSGDYFELSRLTGGNNTDYSYWGSDMLYVQTNKFTQNYCYTSSSGSDNNARLLQVFFTSDSDFSNRESSNNRFSYLYYNGNLLPTGEGSGYACVVPNDKDYARFRVENCSFDGSNQYHVTDGITINGASNVAFSDSYTNQTYNMKVRYLDENGLTLSSITARIYLQTTNANINESPHCHSFSDSNGAAATWPGLGMTWDQDVDIMKKYYCDVEASKYDKVIFAYWSNNSQQSQTVVLNVHSIQNGDTWESKNTTTVGSITVSGKNNKTLKFLNDWTSTEWPHLTFQSN